tara:strand:- start:3127 stop:4671 length:1545 start_codon:yes stop_codon:yes gene_type:complete
MSTGSLTQLAALGSQDQYLSVQGEITFFKGVYRRHTNFAKESVFMQFNQKPAWGSTSTCVISRTGDLLSKTWLNLSLPALNPPLEESEFIQRKRLRDPNIDQQKFENSDELKREFLEANPGKYPKARYCDCVGFAAIDKIDLVIGGTLIDSHPGHYLHVWDELTQTPEKKQIGHLVGRSGSEAELEEMAMHPQDLYVPLQFWFCRHLMCSLPLIALQYHQVEIKVTFKEFRDVVAFPGYDLISPGNVLHDGNNDVIPADGASAKFSEHDEDFTALSSAKVRPVPPKGATEYQLDAKLMCNLVYLEEEERKTFAGSTHEYLIDLLQYQGPHPCGNMATTYHAYFNHPTSELIWTFVPKVSIEEGEPFNYTALQSAYNSAGDPLKEARLQFNGYDRFTNMPATYFREIVPAQYHTSVPTRPIYVYSFALEPEDFRPSGSVNLSRIDNVKLITSHVNFEPTATKHPETAHRDQKGLFLHTATGKGSAVKPGAELRVYARSKNVLRIKSGMAGLAYAN